MDGKGAPGSGRLAIRISEASGNSAAATAVGQARAVEQSLSPPPTADALTTLTNTVENQSDLAKSITSLLAKVEILVKVGDELAKVRLSLSLHHYSRWLKSVAGTSLCKLCLASALRGFEGWLDHCFPIL